MKQSDMIRFLAFCVFFCVIHQAVAQTPDSFLILTDASAPHILPSGGNVQITGSSGGNTIFLSIGANVACQNFTGPNQIVLNEASSQFSAHRTGATVYFSGKEGTRLQLAAKSTAQAIYFSDGRADLIIQNSKVMLGDQEITGDATTLQSPVSLDLPPDTASDVLPGQVNAYLILTDQSAPFDIPAGAFVRVTGSSGGNHLTLASGGRVELQNFVGANQVNIEDASEKFMALRSGATVSLIDPGGTWIQTAAKTTPQVLEFADGSHSLLINGNQVLLGDQEVTEAPQAVYGPAQGGTMEGDAYEDDDAWTRAKWINLHDQRPPSTYPPGYEMYQAHDFHDAGDIDWVKFYGRPVDQYYSLAVKEAGSRCDAKVELFFYQAGILKFIKKIDDYIEEQDELLEFECNQEGMYYVRITNYGNVAGDETGYQLWLYLPIGTFDGMIGGYLTPALKDVAISSGKLKTSSLSDGSYYLAHAAGSGFVLSASAMGYATAQIPFSLNPNESQTINVPLQKLSPPAASFSASAISGKAPLMVKFTATSTGTITSRYWAFGNKSTDSVQNPTHIFNKAGTYRTDYLIQGPGGLSGKSQVITVTP